MKYCPKCKKTLKLKCFYKNKSQKFGVDVYCKSCSKQRSNEYYKTHGKKCNKEVKKQYDIEYKKNNKEKIKKIQRKYNKTLKCRYLDYKKGAVARGLEFNLSKEYFSMFWNSQCYYCGSDIETIGIDRINNELGYVENNCVSCCETCNRAKLDLNFEDWISYLNQIVNFHEKKLIVEKNIDIYCLKNTYNPYKYRARKKNFGFELNKDQFFKFLKSHCFYCGTINYKTATIDRIHNSIGYIENNCVSCCKYCNSGKRNKSYEEFINWIKQLIKFRSHK